MHITQCSLIWRDQGLKIGWFNKVRVKCNSLEIMSSLCNICFEAVARATVQAHWRLEGISSLQPLRHMAPIMYWSCPIFGTRWQPCCQKKYNFSVNFLVGYTKQPGTTLEFRGTGPIHCIVIGKMKTSKKIFSQTIRKGHPSPVCTLSFPSV